MNSMPENQKEKTLVLRDRRLLELDGVSEVVGFDEAAVFLKTACGPLTVEGKGLHLTRLDLDRGIVSVEGTVSSILYTEEKGSEGRGFFSRLLK